MEIRFEYHATAKNRTTVGIYTHPEDVAAMLREAADTLDELVRNAQGTTLDTNLTAVVRFPSPVHQQAIDVEVKGRIR